MNFNIYIKYWDDTRCSADDPKLGLDWYRHSKRNPYKGFSIIRMFFGRQLNIDFVHGLGEFVKMCLVPAAWT